MTKFKRLSVLYIVWMIILTGIPLLLMIFFSTSNITDFSKNYNFNNYEFTLETFKYLVDGAFLRSLGRSLLYALISTVFTLLLGYPIAYFISRSKLKHKYLLLLILIMPMWTNMILRIKTINNLISGNSFFTNVFHFTIDLSAFPELKLVSVMTLVYLPFMIFPIYTVLEKIDSSLFEAARDLGAGPVKTFFKVTLPLSAKGMYSGIMMVFLPAAMSYTIPQIVTGGSTDYTMVGQLIEQTFKKSPMNYNQGSVWSIIIIILVLGSLYIISSIDEEGETLL